MACAQKMIELQNYTELETEKKKKDLPNVEIKRGSEVSIFRRVRAFLSILGDHFEMICCRSFALAMVESRIPAER